MTSAKRSEAGYTGLSMQKTCANSWCKKPFEIDNDNLAFYEKVSPEFAREKFPMPPPTRCPDCRRERRMAWRNERSLYTRPCELCKKTKVSCFPPQSPTHAYCRDCLYCDKWDPTDYGRDFDFSRTFFENLQELLKDVPVMMLYQSGVNENCDFINFAGTECKNCYLIFNSGKDEDCYHCRGVLESKDCSDMLIGNGDRFCYECVNCGDCYHISFSQNCSLCSESAFLFNCRRCRHCFGCTNMVEKE